MRLCKQETVLKVGEFILGVQHAPDPSSGDSDVLCLWTELWLFQRLHDERHVVLWGLHEHATNSLRCLHAGRGSTGST